MEHCTVGPLHREGHEEPILRDANLEEIALAQRDFVGVLFAFRRRLLDCGAVVEALHGRDGWWSLDRALRFEVGMSGDDEYGDQQPARDRHGARTLRKYRYRSTATPRAVVSSSSMM